MCCATSGCTCVHPREPRRGQVTFGSHVTTVLLLRKKRGKSRACTEHTFGQGKYRTGPLPVTWLTSLLVKRPYWGGYGATSGCICAEHTSGQDHFRPRDWRHFRSRHFWSCAMVRSSANTTLSSPYTTDDILVCTRINIQHFLTHLQINNATTFFYHAYISIKYTPLVSCGVNMYVNYKYRPLYGVCWYL